MTDAALASSPLVKRGGRAPWRVVGAKPSCYLRWGEGGGAEWGAIPPWGAATAAGPSLRGGVVVPAPGGIPVLPGPCDGDSVGARGEGRGAVSLSAGRSRLPTFREMLGSAFCAGSLQFLPGRAGAAPRPPRPRGTPLAAPPAPSLKARGGPGCGAAVAAAGDESPPARGAGPRGPAAFGPGRAVLTVSAAGPRR